jgi:hypothetical protein
MKPLTHFYHLYVDGHYEQPLEEHMSAMESSGLLYELEDFYVGLVGSPENRATAKKLVPGVVIAEADAGWEQVTLSALHHYSKENDRFVFYAHTKGACSNDDFAKRWRSAMTNATVTKWRECIEALESVDCSGPYWILSDEPEHEEHNMFFAGNFWWATTDYLRRLPSLRYDNRFRAEGWIGLGEPTVRVTHEGYPFWGNF